MAMVECEDGDYKFVLNTDAVSIMKADLSLKFQAFSHLNYVS